MDTIVIQSGKKSISAFILEMAKMIHVKARVLSDDEMEDLRLNRMLKDVEKNVAESEIEKVYKTLRKHGAEI